MTHILFQFLPSPAAPHPHSNPSGFGNHMVRTNRCSLLLGQQDRNVRPVSSESWCTLAEKGREAGQAEQIYLLRVILHAPSSNLTKCETTCNSVNRCYSELTANVQAHPNVGSAFLLHWVQSLLSAATLNTPYIKLAPTATLRHSLIFKCWLHLQGHRRLSEKKAVAVVSHLRNQN